MSFVPLSLSKVLFKCATSLQRCAAFACPSSLIPTLLLLGPPTSLAVSSCASPLPVPAQPLPPLLTSLPRLLAGELLVLRLEPLMAAADSPSAVALAKQATAEAMAAALADAPPAPTSPRTDAGAQAARDKDVKVLADLQRALDKKVGRNKAPQGLDDRRSRRMGGSFHRDRAGMGTWAIETPLFLFQRKGTRERTVVPGYSMLCHDRPSPGLARVSG